MSFSTKIDYERMTLDISYVFDGDELYKLSKKVKFLVNLPRQEHPDTIYCLTVASVVDALQKFGRNISKTDVYNFFSENRGNGCFAERLQGATITKL